MSLEGDQDLQGPAMRRRPARGEGKDGPGDPWSSSGTLSPNVPARKIREGGWFPEGGGVGARCAKDAVVCRGMQTMCSTDRVEYVIRMRLCIVLMHMALLQNKFAKQWMQQCSQNEERGSLRAAHTNYANT